jgi:N utilization substance protein A
MTAKALSAISLAATAHGAAARHPAAELIPGHLFNETPSIAASMLAALGRNGIRTIEDLAACATDDLLGWTERRGEVLTQHPGIFEHMNVSRSECDSMILQARVRAGWIEAASLNR